MLPYVTVLGRTIPMYGVMAACGFAAALLFICLRARRFHNSADDSAYLLLWIVIGGMIGAKIVYILTVLPQFLHDLAFIRTSPGHFFQLYLSGGFVFYGGAIGGLASAFLAARFFGLTLTRFVPQFVPAIPLGHAFGRIGCFCAGCCYGIPFHPGVVFHDSPIAPHGVELFPVQLLEAGAELVIFVVLVIATNKGMDGWEPLALYAGLYALVRFSDEFLRGDTIRGIFAGLSTSQWISLLVLILTAVYAIWRIRTGRSAQSAGHSPRAASQTGTQAGTQAQADTARVSQ